MIKRLTTRRWPTCWPSRTGTKRNSAQPIDYLSTKPFLRLWIVERRFNLFPQCFLSLDSKKKRENALWSPFRALWNTRNTFILYRHHHY